MPEWYRKATEFPKYHSYYTNIRTDPEGNILLLIEFDRENQTQTFAAFTLEGDYLATFTSIVHNKFKGKYTYNVRRDEDGFPSVYREMLK